MKQTNCWIPMSEAKIPPILHKGFKENVIIRKSIEPIIKKKSDFGVEKEEQRFVNQGYDDQVDNETVLLVEPQYDDESPTMLLNNDPRMCAYIKRMKTGEIIKVNKNNFVIGKSNSADYVITGNPTISRRHVEITKTEDGYYLNDLQSANHTYICEKEITQPVKLVNGTEIRLAKEIFVFSIMIEN